MAKTNEQQLEETINDLKLDKIYKDFFASDGKSKNFDSKCNVFNEKGKEKPEAPKLCSSLVYYLEKIREMSSKQDSNKYCGYLPYWLYDKIGKIHSPLTTKIDKVPFYADLIKAGNAISGAHLKQLCTIPTLKDVDLNELKKRKISYIYFKNFENIYNISTSKNKADCAKYLTYLESFKSLYEAYKKTLCSYIFIPPIGPDYFPCSYKYDLKNLMSGLQNCKDGKDPYPKLQVAAASRTVSSGTGAAAGPTGARGSPEQTGLKGSPGSVGTGGTARTTSTTALSSQGRTTSVASAPQARAGGALTIPSVGAPQLAQGPSGSADLTRVTGDTPSTLPGVVTPPAGFSETASEMLKSNSFRHTLVGAAIICGLLFLFFFFKSTSLGSGSHERGKRRRETEQNYYEDYGGDDGYGDDDGYGGDDGYGDDDGYGGDDGYGDDEGHRGRRRHRGHRSRRGHRSHRGHRGHRGYEEPAAYGSEPSVAPSQASDMNLSYQPRRDSYY